MPDIGVEPIHLHRSAVERSPLPTVLTATEEFVIRYANPAFCGLCASPFSDLVGMRLASLFRGAEVLEALLERVARDGVTDVAADVAFVCSEGRAFHGTAIVTPLRDERGRPRGLSVQILDATEQVRARAREAEAARELKEANDRLIVAGIREQELADRANQSAAELKALLAAMGEGVTVFGPSGEIVLVNAVGRAVLGFSSESPTLEDYRRCDFRRLDGAPLDFEREVLSRIVRGEAFSEEEVLLHRADGTVQHIVLSGGAVRDARGEVALAMNLYRDVTEVRELERVREQCLSLITHDLRSPLTAAMFTAEVIQMNRAGYDPPQLAGRILLNLTRMEEMIRNLLDVQRLHAGHRLPLRLGECDLVAIAREVADDLASFHDQRVVVHGEACVLGVWGEGELRRAIWNLASNALKYGARGAPVTIAVERVGELATVAVHNEGLPIAAEDQARLFAPFSRTRSAMEGGQRGWGLGLTFVRGCAEAHGGRVTVESDAERGTTFTLALPLDAGPYQELG
ncbi:sensor histidine kinase [Sorangium cellulosum]|nr:PAS domain-containing sensor histidine kinase [Sorangium cellulosum]